MATHQLYVGGPAGTNISRAQYPRPVFNAADWADVGVSAHKPHGVVVLNRTFDVADYAIADYLRKNPVANADVLNLDVIPGGSLLLGMHVWVEKPAADATLTFAAGGIALGEALSGTAASKSFVVPGGTRLTAAGYVDVGGAAVAPGMYYFPNPVVLAATLGQTTALNLAGLRVHTSLLLAELIPHNRSQANV